jgi:shikimate dehydrogenase
VFLIRSDKLKRCGLLGRDIQYSKSPQIHNSYYLEKKVPISYELFDVGEDQISDFIDDLRKKNIIGFNVTIPYKEMIIKYLNKTIYPADKIAAVNTVVVEANKLIGYNTDYYGFIKSLECFSINLHEKKALVIGAGGAAKCIVVALTDLNCSSIVIAARNINKAEKYFMSDYKIVSLYDFIDLMDYDIVINCTPIGSVNYKNILPINFSRIKEKCIFYDLIYKPEKTEFLRKAEQLGAFIINGEKMLMYQAYRAADIWIENMNT